MHADTCVYPRGTCGTCHTMFYTDPTHLIPSSSHLYTSSLFLLKIVGLTKSDKLVLILLFPMFVIFH
jgi:hypothetical protein